LLSVLNSGVWSYNGQKETDFNRLFAKFNGTEYSICAANGTVTLQLALEACEIGYGDEVIVPGLTWQATAGAVLDVNAVPVLVDVCEENWCMDPEKVKEAITPRTKAIIPVHLYGCFVDMEEIMAIAARHKLRVIEDCAHKHGAVWKDQRAGSIGDIGSFSFQLSKLMTCGEGGALITNDPVLYEKLDALRNCGRRPEKTPGADKGTGLYGDEGNFMQSGNYRITEFQAALLVEALKRLPSQNKHRDDNAKYLNKLLNQIPGIIPMKRDPREKLEAYYNFSFRFQSEEFKELPVDLFRKALSAELGIPVEPCYQPLNNCPLYQPLTKPWRYRLTADHWKQIDPKRFSLPVSQKVYTEESVCMHFSVLMADREDMQVIGDAIQKVSEQVESLSRLV
jgi:L-glutamine:2-deoxy-scyllo-inosose/3-amino-2,3-dideoxy-scyllo-inosose aminotransferase